MDAKADKRGVSKRIASFFDGELFFGALFALLLCFHLSVNLWWLGADDHVVWADEEAHMAGARLYYQALFLGDYANVFERLIAVSKIVPPYPVHPPLMHILGACMLAIFGYSTDAIALTNTFVFFSLLIGVYLIAREFLASWPSLWVVFVASFTPALYVDSRYAMIDYLAASLAVWAVYALLKSDRFRRSEWVFIFAAINGLAILTRTVAFLYYLAPCAVVVGAGFLLVFKNKHALEKDALNARRFFFHIVLTITVSVGIFAPWYFNNIGHFYSYWAEQRVGGVVRQILPDQAAQAETSAMAAPAPVDGNNAAKKKPAPKSSIETLLHKLAHPRVEWSRYLILVINNSLFLPLFLLSVLGFFLTLARAQFRNFTTLLLFAWVAGSYFFMTELFHFGNPRYALPAVPALAIYAALPFLVPMSQRLRPVLMLGFSALLLFTFGNLSVHAYANFPKAEIPFPINIKAQEQFEDRGLVIYKPRLPQSVSFSMAGPPTQSNYKRDCIEAILRHESGLEILRGEYANYQKLNTQGRRLFEFEEEHYWPDSPFYKRNLPVELQPKRKIRMIGDAQSLPELFSRIADTDYVIYTIDVGRETEELEWQEQLSAQGFAMIKRFRVDRSGAVPARYHAVFAHKLAGQSVVLETPADVDTLGLAELETVLASPQYQTLAPELRTKIETRRAELAAPPQ